MSVRIEKVMGLVGVIDLVVILGVMILIPMLVKQMKDFLYYIQLVHLSIALVDQIDLNTIENTIILVVVIVGVIVGIKYQMRFVLDALIALIPLT